MKCAATLTRSIPKASNEKIISISKVAVSDAFDPLPHVFHFDIHHQHAFDTLKNPIIIANIHSVCYSSRF